MNAPVIARVLGLLFVIAGAAGFVPWIAPIAPFTAPVIAITAQYRMLFGIFPVNAAHDALHILFGIWGIAAGAGFGVAVFYCRIVAIVYLILVIFGALPLLNTLLGVAPIYGWDIALHAVIALLAAYGGFGRGSHPPQIEEQPG
ncbi:MAG TPA: DUF4383 domain-containing protein [Candidatus Aquilonibacter sp.]